MKKLMTTRNSMIMMAILMLTVLAGCYPYPLYSRGYHDSYYRGYGHGHQHRHYHDDGRSRHWRGYGRHGDDD